VVHVEKPFILCTDEADPAEGFMLLATHNDGAKENDKGVITFTKGGQFGGYWKFQKA